MKKFSLVLAIIFALGVLFSSCNRKSCPAYSHNDQEQPENYDG
jgi:hypothetical protein